MVVVNSEYMEVRSDMKKAIFEPGENNVKIVDMTAEEIAQYKKDELEAEAELQKIAQRQALRTSARAKLAALGLTEDEIAAL